MNRTHLTLWLAGTCLCLLLSACSTSTPEITSLPLTQAVETGSADLTEPAVPPEYAEQAPAQAAAEGASTSATVGMDQGARMQVANARGDQITLTIPPMAISPTVDVSLATYDSAPLNPIAANFFPGIRLEPSGLHLRRPATLEIELVQPSESTPALLFQLVQPELALPLGEQNLEGSRLTAQVYHFSTLLAGKPTQAEAVSQAELAGNLPADPGGDWQYETDLTGGLNQWSQTLNSMGDSTGAESIINDAKERLKQDLVCLMTLGCTIVPIEPCGEYLEMILRYFQQATLLGFDEGSPEMQFLHDELTKRLNECTNRFQLEYDHSQIVDEGEFTNDIHVFGKVTFWAPIYGVFDIGNLQLEGNGAVDVTMTGQADECVMNGAGKNQVVISGQIVADDMGSPWLEITSTETWYSPFSATVTCEDYTQGIPIAALGATHPIRIPLQDGYVYEQPHSEGKGYYRWTLHVIHMW